MTVVPYDTISTTSQTDSVFTKCCCCIPLRIGCFIMAYLSLIINSIHTLSLVCTFAYVGSAARWFDHADTNGTVAPADADADGTVGKPLPVHAVVYVMLTLFANAAWLCINIACLVGLHKKRPGPIKLYVAFAIARLVVISSGVVYLISVSTNTSSYITYIVDLGLAAYFVYVYYIYAMQLELGQRQKADAPVINSRDHTAVQRTKLDKQGSVA